MENVTRAYICDSCGRISTVTWNNEFCNGCWKATRVLSDQATEIPIPKSEFGTDFIAVVYQGKVVDVLLPSDRTSIHTTVHECGMDGHVQAFVDRTESGDGDCTSSGSHPVSLGLTEFVVYSGKKQEVDRASSEQEAEKLVGEYKTVFGQGWNVWFENARPKALRVTQLGEESCSGRTVDSTQGNGSGQKTWLVWLDGKSIGHWTSDGQNANGEPVTAQDIKTALIACQFDAAIFVEPSPLTDNGDRDKPIQVSESNEKYAAGAERPEEGHRARPACRPVPPHVSQAGVRGQLIPRDNAADARDDRGAYERRELEGTKSPSTGGPHQDNIREIVDGLVKPRREMGAQSEQLFTDQDKAMLTQLWHLLRSRGQSGAANGEVRGSKGFAEREGPRVPS